MMCECSIFQSRQHALLSITEFGNNLYTYTKNIEIFFISKKKIEIITSDTAITNFIAADVSLNNKYAVCVPFEFCEVRGFISVFVDFTEKEIYDNELATNLQRFGPLLTSCKVVEIMRFCKLDATHAKTIQKFKRDSADCLK